MIETGVNSALDVEILIEKPLSPKAYGVVKPQKPTYKPDK